MVCSFDREFVAAAGRFRPCNYAGDFEQGDLSALPARLFAQQTFDEGNRIEHSEVVELLAGADEAHRNA